MERLSFFSALILCFFARKKHLNDDVCILMFLVTAKTVGKFTYLENDNISLTLYNEQQPIKWPWGLERPTDKLTCEDDKHACPQEGLKSEEVLHVVWSCYPNMEIFIVFADSLFLQKQFI